MTHQPASSQPRLTERRIPRIYRRATGLAVMALAFLAAAPAALAIPLPPPDGGGPPGPPPPPPSTTAVAHLPLRAVVAIVVATVVLSVATTLVTLSLEHMRRARIAAAAAPQPVAQTSPTTAEPQAGQADVISSHHYDVHRADRR